MQKFDGLFLDFYGTLVGGDREAVESVCRRIVEQYALSITPEQLGVDWGKGYFALSEVCNDGHFRTLYQIECDSLVATMRPLVGHDIDPAPFVAGLTDWLRSPPVFAETHDVLATLRRSGIPVCLVSNADHEDLLAALSMCRIEVDHVITSESARSYKPDGAIFRQALEHTGWSPSRVAHVGDSLHSDVGGARAVGLRSIWLCRSIRISDIGTAEPDHRIGDLQDLLDLV